MRLFAIRISPVPLVRAFRQASGRFPFQAPIPAFRIPFRHHAPHRSSFAPPGRPYQARFSANVLAWPAGLGAGIGIISFALHGVVCRQTSLAITGCGAQAAIALSHLPGSGCFYN